MKLSSTGGEAYCTGSYDTQNDRSHDSRVYLAGLDPDFYPPKTATSAVFFQITATTTTHPAIGFFNLCLLQNTSLNNIRLHLNLN